MEEKVYELISLGLREEDHDKESVRAKLENHFALKKEEAEMLMNGSYRMYPLYLDQARHFAKEFNQLGIITEIRKKSAKTPKDNI